MRRILSYMEKVKGKSILAPLFKCLESMFELFVPLVIARMIDQGIRKENLAVIWHSLFLLLALACVGCLTAVIAQYFAAEVAMVVGKSYRRDLFHKILSLPYRDYNELSASSLITRIGPDIFQIESTVNMVLRLLMRSPFIVVGACIMAFRMSARLSVLFLFVLLLLSIVVFGIMVLTMPFYKRIQVSLENITRKYRENIMGIRVVRAFCQEEKEEEEFLEKNQDYTKVQIAVGKISALLNPMSMLLIQFGLMGILYFSSKMVNDGRLFQGNVVALTNYMSQILLELLKLANLIILMVKAYASISRIEEVMERKNEEDQSVNDKEASTLSTRNQDTEKVQKQELDANASSDSNKAGILLKNLSFSYEVGEERALSDISFSLKEGESLGIIGGTGSGKSTLISLICGFYADYEGEIFLWGKNLRDYSKRELRESIAYVPQKAVLFSGTLKENLLWRKQEAKDEELWKALEIAQGKDFVEEKGEGLDLSVSIEGKNFSGGQRQRLSIARALVGDSKLLILDDSASALDMLTERKLRTALEGYQGEKSLLVISQRVSSIRHFPKILVLDQGKLIGLGSHQELMENCSVYQEICASQKQGKEA